MLWLGVFGRLPSSMPMRDILHFAGLSALSAALLLGPVPIVPCQQVQDCPMIAAHAAAGAGGRCDYGSGSHLDCCVDHRAPPADASGSIVAGPLGAAAAAPAAAAATVPPAPRPRTPAQVRTGEPVPLYTLHATLLI